MAAVGRAGSFGSSSASGAANNAGAELRAGGEEDDGQNLWSCILSEVSTRSRSKLPSGKSVLLLELSVAATLPALSGAFELPSEENAVRGLWGCLLNLLQNFLPSDLLLVT